MFKHTKLLFIVLLTVPTLAFAQRDSLRMAMTSYKAKAIAARMAEDLQLTPAQTNAIEKLALERFHNLKLENQNDAARFERANQKAAPKLRAILTQEQHEKYQAMRADAKKQKAEHLKQNPAYKASDEDFELDF
jgi:hypothetical protein